MCKNKHKSHVIFLSPKDRMAMGTPLHCNFLITLQLNYVAVFNLERCGDKKEMKLLFKCQISW